MAASWWLQRGGMLAQESRCPRCQGACRESSRPLLPRRPLPEKPESQITQEIQAIIRQITASVTFLPLLSDACKLQGTAPSLAWHHTCCWCSFAGSCWALVPGPLLSMHRAPVLQAPSTCWHTQTRSPRCRLSGELGASSIVNSCCCPHSLSVTLPTPMRLVYDYMVSNAGRRATRGTSPTQQTSSCGPSAPR